MSFRYEYKLKHFFKPCEYEDEHEVRILFQIEDKATKVTEVTSGWGLTNDHSVINPYVEFSLNHKDLLPFKIIKVVLGPTCPAKSLNKVQLQEMIKDKGIGDIECDVSSITTYI